MKIGHINLASTFDETGAHFVALVEALDRQDIEQHVIVRNDALARRLSVCKNATVGPVTASSVVAYCLMPQVEVAHVHTAKSAPSGLLLTLTRSIPFVLTHRHAYGSANNPLVNSIHERAASIICNCDDIAHSVMQETSMTPIDVIADIERIPNRKNEMVGNRAAAEHLRVYRRAADTWRVPALLL